MQSILSYTLDGNIYTDVPEVIYLIYKQQET